MLSLRRSWFHRPRWWVTSSVTVLSLLELDAVHVLVTHEGWSADLGGRALLVGSVAVSPTWSVRRSSRRWEELESSSLVSDAERVVAERVVRDGAPVVDERVRHEAMRIATLRWEELRTERSVGAPVAGVLGLVLAGAGVLATAWWLVPPALCWGYVAQVLLAVRRMARRREGLVTSPTGEVGNGARQR